MPTDKPKIQIYVSSELQKSVLDFCDREAVSQSEVGSKAIANFINPNIISIELSEEMMKELEAWACEERRMPEQQAQIIIERLIDQRINK